MVHISAAQARVPSEGLVQKHRSAARDREDLFNACRDQKIGHMFSHAFFHDEPLLVQAALMKASGK